MGRRMNRPKVIRKFASQQTISAPLSSRDVRLENHSQRLIISLNFILSQVNAQKERRKKARVTKKNLGVKETHELTAKKLVAASHRSGKAARKKLKVRRLLFENYSLVPFFTASRQGLDILAPNPLKHVYSVPFSL